MLNKHLLSWLLFCCCDGNTSGDDNNDHGAGDGGGGRDDGDEDDVGDELVPRLVEEQRATAGATRPHSPRFLGTCPETTEPASSTLAP